MESFVFLSATQSLSVKPSREKGKIIEDQSSAVCLAVFMSSKPYHNDTRHLFFQISKQCPSVSLKDSLIIKVYKIFSLDFSFFISKLAFYN